MDSPILKEITKFLHERKKQRRNTIIFAFVALVVVAGTAATLRMIGQAMTRKEKVLVCALEVHEHDKKDCYDDDKNLICGLADYVVHVHNDDCYDATGDLVCPLPEIEPHEHTDKCYEEEEILVCTEEESDGHKHTDDCYETVQGDLACGMDEHEHDDGCYDEEGNLACEKEEHEHSDDCYDEEEVLACGQKEGADGHTHDDSCYERHEILTCGELELHTHDEKKCYDEDGRLTCDKTVLEEHVHSDELGCFEIREAVTEADLEREYFSEESETEEPDDVSATESEETSEEEKTVYTTEENEEAEETAEDTEDAADVSATEPEVSQITKTYAGEGYNVTASYTEEAELPEEAELIAVQITPESDSERFAKRAAEYKEALGNENASPKALFNIGFYVDGEEVEPKVPVTITIQFLDENGMPEGTPVTVVHFGEEGNEVLDGGKMEDGSTSFQMGSFSDAMVGTGTNMNEPLDIEEAETGAKYLNLDHTFPYENDAFHIDFHITGQVRLPESVELPTTAGDEKTSSGVVTEDAGESQPDKEADEENSVRTPKEGEIFTTTGEISEESEETTVEGEAGEDEEAMSGESADGEVSADGVVPMDPTYQDLELKVELLDENSAEHKAITEQIDKNSDGKSVMMQAMIYGMTYKGKPVSLTNCDIKAKLTPTENFQNQIGEISPAENTESDDASNVIELTVYQVRENAVVEEEVEETEEGVVPDEEDAVTSDSDTLDKVANGDIDPANPGQSMDFDLDGSAETVVVDTREIANPKFRVQYYAYLDRINYSDQPFSYSAGTAINSANTVKAVWDAYQGVIKGGSVPFIYTSNGTDTKGGASLPENGKVPEIKSVKVSNGSGKLETKRRLTEVYAENDQFTYIKAPTLNYFNALIDNPNYELKQIWVMESATDDAIVKADTIIEKAESEKIKNGGSEQQVKEAVETAAQNSGWKIYKELENLHFTNREQTAIEKHDFILINDETAIRLVYDTKPGKANNPAVFYDYDISDGVASNNEMYTAENGINSSSNYADQTNANTRFAFGNSNTRVNAEYNLWNGARLNMTNRNVGVNANSKLPWGNGGFAGCTFGLASGTKKNSAGETIVNLNAPAPEIFGSTAQIGKTVYKDKYSLDFSQDGDTYTLTNVKGSQTAKNLDTFNHPIGAYEYTHIYTNNFWPMDGVTGSDPHWGAVSGKYHTNGHPNTENGGGAIREGNPVSDDWVDHNTYFGMSYEIGFDLDAAYTGPLEYIFYGDDDMWVFLDDETLVCDIGGVHSSVGEVVNLWNYIEKSNHKHADECFNDDGSLNCNQKVHHTLKIFYTERGASGSSCWMQFTLPSVTTMGHTNKSTYGSVKIQKNVTTSTEITGFDKTQDTFDFRFNIEEGYDDYRIQKYNKDGEKIGSSGLILWNEATFTLKADEYIIISNIPVGKKYTITELSTGQMTSGNVYSSTGTVDGNKQTEEQLENQQVGSTIKPGHMDNVVFTNELILYNLPETGGPGTIPYTMACLLCLLGAGGAGFLYRKKFRERRV